MRTFVVSDICARLTQSCMPFVDNLRHETQCDDKDFGIWTLLFRTDIPL